MAIFNSYVTNYQRVSIPKDPRTGDEALGAVVPGGARDATAGDWTGGEAERQGR